MSAGLTAANALYSGVSRYEAGQERSQLFKANAGIARDQFQSETAAGAANENAVRMRNAARTGQEVAAIGANGLTQGGTNANVVASNAAVGEMDALAVRNNALRRAWGFEVQGASDEMQARFASRGGDFSAADSILTGGAKAYTEDKATGSWF